MIRIEEALNPFKNERYKRWKSLEWIVWGVSFVAWTVMCVAMWNPEEYLSRNARHGWMVGSWLVYGCLMVYRLILMRKRSEMSPLPSPSPLSTLDLSQQSAGAITPVRSEHWNGE